MVQCLFQCFTLTVQGRATYQLVSPISALQCHSTRATKAKKEQCHQRSSNKRLTKPKEGCRWEKYHHKSITNLEWDSECASSAARFASTSQLSRPTTLRLHVRDLNFVAARVRGSALSTSVRCSAAPPLPPASWFLSTPSRGASGGRR